MHDPEPLGNDAVRKSVVTTVLSHIADAGTSLISLLSGLLAAALILFSGYVLYDTFYTQQGAKSGWDLLQFKPAIVEMNDEDVPQAVQDQLSAINPDYRAWLTVYGTNIDYPVMQGGDDLHYASHDIYGQISLTGSIYMAAANNGNVDDSYTLIYGHHMDNKAMFGGLDEYVTMDRAGEIIGADRGYFSGHREGILVSRNAIYDLNAFAVLKTDAYESSIYTTTSMGTVLSFLREKLAAPDEKSATLLLDEGALGGATKIVGLSTCASASTDGRLVVFYTATKRNLIKVEATGYRGVYDGAAHTLTYSTNYPGDEENPTTVEFSIDGGRTWTETQPSVTNVNQSTNVIVRVTNDIYGRATAEVRLEVTPKAVTVTADGGQQKVYGQGDPVFTATATGLLNGETVEYTVGRPGAGTDENVGTYADALVPTGAAEQGNYTVTYAPAGFTVVPSSNLRLSATGFEDVFDGAPHVVNATASAPEGTRIEYSTDGGQTWTEEPPSMRNVGEMTVTVRATNPNYETVTATVPLRIRPRAVTVAAVPASKAFDSRDPALTATVTGVLQNDRIEYTVARPGAGTDEDAGTYAGAIVPTGRRWQGNYEVTFVPADFTVTPSDQLTVTAAGYTGVYDGAEHRTTATASVPANTRIEYSTDGGQTWTTTPPGITNVGTIRVQYRATNPNYATVTGAYTLRVEPAVVTVRANNGTKAYGQEDPAFTATVTGVVDEAAIEYTVSRPQAGAQQDVGIYAEAIVATGEEFQGNYRVVFENGTFEIAPAQGMRLQVRNVRAIYDGEEHAIAASGSTSDGSVPVIEYSLDDGVTWTVTPPSMTDVGRQDVRVRATHPNFETAEATAVLQVLPRRVIVTAASTSKIFGSDDPELTAQVEGLLEGDEIRYTLTREEGEEVGTYQLIAQGEGRQGNYEVVYRPGTLRIVNDPQAAATPTPSPSPTATPEPEIVEDPLPPLARVTQVFEPKGNAGRKVWALLNLICLVISVYIFLPLFHLGAKFSRTRHMGRINKDMRRLRTAEGLTADQTKNKSRLEKLMQNAGGEGAEADAFDAAVEALFYQVKKFLRRFRIGIALELVMAALAVVVFLLTEDMRQPMVLIDKWTPLMILLMLGSWVLDVRFIRYREKVMADEEEAELRRQEQAGKK